MQSASFELNRNSQFIRAGAGAGKTTKLIETFLEFVRNFKKDNDRFPRVVMTTFTRKATQEVKERLLVKAKDEIEIFEFINKKSFVHISTIHGLLSLFLSQYADRIKFPREIKIIDGPQYDKIVKRQMNEVFKKSLKYHELLETYGFNELALISKRTMDLKSQHKDLNYVNQIELKRLAEKSKSEIIDCIKSILDTGRPTKGWIEYFDHLKALMQSLKSGNETHFFELLDEFPKKPQWKETNPSIEPFAHELILKLKNDLLENLYDTADYIQRHEALNSLFNEFINELFLLNSERKRQSGELTISDLENLTLQIIEQENEAAKEFSDSWDYFMIDEYQDTSPVQVSILNEFIRQKPCFIVGDPQQSIYLFRGARSEVFERKQKEMELYKAKVDFLQTNYRSDPGLMDFINDFFSKFSSQFKPMIPNDSVEKKDPSTVVSYYIKTENQAEGVLVHIQKLLSEGVKPQDICVLSRNNKNLEQVALAASKINLNVQLQSAAGFEDKREILDLISFSKFLNNPHDDENLISLVRSPWFFIEDEVILNLAEKKTLLKQSFWKAVLASDLTVKTSLNHYLELFDLEGVLQATKSFIKDSGFLNFSSYYDRTGKREANIVKYLTTLSQSERLPGFSLGLFLDEQFQSLSLDSGSGNAEAQPVLQPDCVTLMTVHASKGLQFRHVIVIGFADKTPPTKSERLSFDSETRTYSLAIYDESLMEFKNSQWSRSLRESLKQRETEENERVLYVAMTRAIETLSLVADTSKRTDKSSWYSRTIWPESGEYNLKSYKTISKVYDEKAQIKDEYHVHVRDVRHKFSNLKKSENLSQSITDLISQSVSSGTSFDYESQLKNLKKAQYGTDLHRIFESLKFSNKNQIIENLSANDRKAVDYLFSQKELDMNQLLSIGYNEWGFGLKTKTKFIQGQIDLWGEADDAIHLLDYKTGSSQYSDKAFTQLSFYTMALYAMKLISKNKKIIHSVVYPLEQKTHQKHFKNVDDFQVSLSLKEKEQFEDIVGIT